MRAGSTPRFWASAPSLAPTLDFQVARNQCPNQRGQGGRGTSPRLHTRVCKSPGQNTLAADSPAPNPHYWSHARGTNLLPPPPHFHPRCMPAGHWLKGCGIMIHVIQNDPTVPRTLSDWKVRARPQQHWPCV